MGKSYFTSADIIEAVKRKIAFPIDQVTFTSNDILAFINEEMMISQVPSVMKYHEEYFVYLSRERLTDNRSKYPIPYRAIGMRLRDLMWSDQDNNFYDMTRLQPEDKAFFQRNEGANSAIHKFYVEGNDVVLTPSLTDNPNGHLNFWYFLRPNQLVANERAITVQSFSSTIQIDNDFMTSGTTISVENNPNSHRIKYPDDDHHTHGNHNIGLVPDVFTAVVTNGGTITSIISALGSPTVTIIGSANHGLLVGQFVTIAGSDSLPTINNTYEVVTVPDVNTFTINKQIGVNGTTGTWTSPNFFVIGVDSITTAGNLANALTLVGNVFSATNGQPIGTDTVTVQSLNFKFNINTLNPLGFIVPQDTIGIVFTSTVPTTYIDPILNVSEPLFVNGALVDFLQTNPGHRTYCFDVQIPKNGISGNTITFNRKDLTTWSGTSASPDVIRMPIDFKPGDYICLSGECIIPQIPPDLHTGLAERASARVLAALGDQAGLQVANAKIQEIDGAQGTLVDDRSEGNPQKVLNRNSLLRYGKQGPI